MKKVFLSLFVGVFAVFSGRAQSDFAAVQFSQPYFATGETIWFQLFLPDFFHEKTAVRLAIFEKNGQKTAENWFFSNEKKLASGYIQIPFEWPSANYQFQFSATDSLGFFHEILTTNLPILNAFQALPKFVQNESFIKKNNSIFFSKNEIFAENADPMTTSTFVPEHQPIWLKSRSKSTDFSDAIGSFCVTDSDFFSDADGHIRTQKCPVFAPNFGKKIRIGGVVESRNEKPVEVPLIGARDRLSGAFLFSKSDKNGHFFFDFDGNTGKSEFQILDFEGRDLRFLFEDLEPKSAVEPLVFTQKMADYLADYRDRKKIFQLYGKSEIAPEISKKKQQELTPQKLISVPKFSFNVPDYERFDNLETFFREVIWQVQFIKKNGRVFGQMYDYDAQDFHTRPTLFLLDGLATFEAEEIAKIDPRDLKTIELLTEKNELKHDFPGFGAGGVVRIQSLTGQISQENISKISLAPLIPEADFPKEFKSNADEPDLRSVIFWKKNVSAPTNLPLIYWIKMPDLAQKWRISGLFRLKNGEFAVFEN